MKSLGYTHTQRHNFATAKRITLKQHSSNQ
jgi:hypothetical protein